MSKIIVFFSYFLISLCVLAQNKTYQNRIEEYNLFTYCKFWGLIKYYHPGVCKKGYNLDKELLRVLPQIKIANKTQFNAIIDSQLLNLGFENYKCSKVNVKESNLKAIGTNTWITENILLNSDNKLKLVKISNYNYYKNYKVFENELRYTQDTLKVDNLTIYENKLLLNQNVALLSLFKYWNIINYYYPYKLDLKKDIDSLLFTYIPKFSQIANKFDYHSCLLRFTKELNDCHGTIIYKNYPVIYEFIGNLQFDIRTLFIEGKNVIIKDNPKLNLKAGDIIKSINDTQINDYITKFSDYVEWGNQGTFERNVNYFLWCGRQNEKRRLLIERAGKLMNQTIILDTLFSYGQFYYPEYSTENTKVPVNVIFADSCLTNSKKSKLLAEKALGVIIDWRWGGFEIKKWMIKNNTDCAIVFENIGPNIFRRHNENTLVYYGIFGSLKYRLLPKFKGNIIILVNEYTQSSSEINTLAMKYGSNALLVGSNTAGADASISYLNLPGKIKICLTFVSLYLPNGERQQMVGLKPDYLVKPTIKGIMDGRDEQLEFAIDLLKKKSELDSNTKK